jgi:RNA polymerase sigma-70 factor, ECF subfamily
MLAVGRATQEPAPIRSSSRGSLEQRKPVELAFVAALQHLPARQRAVLILREMLGFSALEVSESLKTTAASVNSALQRARSTVDRRLPEQSQQPTVRSLAGRPTGRAAERPRDVRRSEL